MASHLLAMASNLLAMASNLLAMASSLLAMASNLPTIRLLVEHEKKFRPDQASHFVLGKEARSMGPAEKTSACPLTVHGII